MSRVFLALLSAAWAAIAAPVLKFDFSSGKPRAGFTQVRASDGYTAELGYGFETVGSVKPPVYFSIRVPEEGNYKVTVVLGDPARDSVTTVKAELRRLTLLKVSAKAGAYLTRSFVVNVRTPSIPVGGQVKLKDREKTSEAWAWDDKIMLELTDAQPAVRSIEIEKADRLPTIFIAGDSTSTDQPVEPFNSWGQMLPRFLGADIAVANHGESGESLRSFIAERRLDKLLSMIKSGDYPIVQMGHNDQKEKGEGVGALTSYNADLKRFLAEARQRGATPILVTSPHRLNFDPDGKIVNTLGDYPGAVRQVGVEENVAVIDLNAMSKVFYEALGPEDAPKAFADGDKTHHNNYGSYELARCVVEGIRQTELPLARFIAADVMAFDPAHPDSMAAFDVPAEPREQVQRPYGN